MLNQLIKKAVKQLGILLIISNIFILKSYSQKHPIDTVILKRKIDSVLLQFGLRSKGFVINVTSVNQSGGQTAYSITNNYYNDPNYIPDSINYSVKQVIKDSMKYIYFFPKKGAWISPFLVYDSLSGDKNIVVGSITQGVNMTLNWKNVKVPLIGQRSESSCSANSPMYIIMKQNENILIGFGDFSASSKTYLYIDGQVKAINLNVSL